MKQILYIVIVLSSMNSCATIMNAPYKYITVYTTQPTEIILKKDTIKTNDNKATLLVERKKEAINIVANTDSLTKAFKVEPNISGAFWSNIMFNYGIGMLVDRHTPKRYTYPRMIYINSTDTIGKYYKYGQSDRKGELHLNVSLPHINSFQLTPENERTKINTGFWGLTIGFDYYHSKDQFINLGASGILDFFVPFPAAVDLSGEHELMTSTYLSFSNNHRYKRFSIGYGLSYSKNIWDFRYYDSFDPPPPTRDPVKKSHITFGFIFPTYFQVSEDFNIGVIYRPTFYRPNMTSKFKYEHLISIDFGWKIRLL